MNTAEVVALIAHHDEEAAQKCRNEEYYITFLEHCLSLQITYPVHHTAFEEVAFFFHSKEEHAQIDSLHAEMMECVRKTAKVKAEVAAPKYCIRQHKKDVVAPDSQAKNPE